MKFKQITVNCTSETSDAVSYALHEAGSMGEVFDDYNDIRNVLKEKRWDYADAALFNGSDKCSVSGFFPMETDENVVLDGVMALRNCDWADFSGLSASVDIIESEAWENEWKKYYKPFSLGKIVIIPEWIDHKPNDGIAVRLNPGLAFGTGTHETTSMCIELMQKIQIADKRVLDFGCGSGILGICANALGASSVIFADTDEQAVDATRYNCRLNGMNDPNVLQCDVRDMEKPADVVIANITADVLIAVEPIIKSALKTGGYAIISGIISAKTAAVVDAYSRDFTLADSNRKNEWSAFIFRS
ncbi:MAG: 50S ribosomal protein L11 methyltransferase [Roseburia sp.]|nr:50S ribosomal protein L11 methyltransferase [Roseburia sp.]